MLPSPPYQGAPVRHANCATEECGKVDRLSGLGAATSPSAPDLKHAADAKRGSALRVELGAIEPHTPFGRERADHHVWDVNARDSYDRFQRCAHLPREPAAARLIDEDVPVEAGSVRRIQAASAIQVPASTGLQRNPWMHTCRS